MSAENNNGKQSILVIGDNPAILRLLKRTLEFGGYNVSLAADGIYGLSLLKETQPDLVLLDVMMPGPDGYEVVDRIRQLSTVPVIMVGSSLDEDAIIKAMSMGADDYVRKPFYPLELVARVRAKIRCAQGQ